MLVVRVTQMTNISRGIHFQYLGISQFYLSFRTLYLYSCQYLDFLPGCLLFFMFVFCTILGGLERVRSKFGKRIKTKLCEISCSTQKLFHNVAYSSLFTVYFGPFVLYFALFVCFCLVYCIFFTPLFVFRLVAVVYYLKVCHLSIALSSFVTEVARNALKLVARTK